MKITWEHAITFEGSFWGSKPPPPPRFRKGKQVGSKIGRKGENDNVGTEKGRKMKKRAKNEREWAKNGQKPIFVENFDFPEGYTQTKNLFIRFTQFIKISFHLNFLQSSRFTSSNWAGMNQIRCGFGLNSKIFINQWTLSWTNRFRYWSNGQNFRLKIGKNRNFPGIFTKFTLKSRSIHDCSRISRDIVCFLAKLDA